MAVYRLSPMSYAVELHSHIEGMEATNRLWNTSTTGQHGDDASLDLSSSTATESGPKLKDWQKAILKVSRC